MVDVATKQHNFYGEVTAASQIDDIEQKINGNYFQFVKRMEC
jgi:hypothetical protein